MSADQAYAAKSLVRIVEPLRAGVVEVRQRALLERLRRVLVAENGPHRVSRNRLVNPLDPFRRIQPAVAQLEQPLTFPGYSPLDRDNVGELRMVWTRALGAGSPQGTPLAYYGGVLYMPNPSDVIQTIDAVTGDLLLGVPPGAARRPHRGRSVGGEAEHRHLRVSTSADDPAYALDAATGRLPWETQILDYTVNPAHQSSGPIVAARRRRPSAIRRPRRRATPPRARPRTLA